MNPRLIAAALYVAMFAWLYSFQDYGFNIWDEGGYAYGTLRTYHGQMALKDFNPNGYPPGRYLYGAFFFHLFGISIQSLRLGVTLLTPGMVLMVYAVGRNIMPPGFAFLSALATLSAPAMYYNRFYTLFTVALMFCLAEFIREPKAWRGFLLAGVAVLASFFKIEVALFGTAISVTAGIILALHHRRTDQLIQPASASFRSGKPRLWIPSAIGAAGLAALSVYALRLDIPQKVWELVMETHEVWGNPFPALFPFFKLYKENGPHEMFERVLFYLPILTYAAVLAIAGAGILGRKGRILKDDLQVLCVLSFGLSAFGLVIWRAGFDNLLRTLPPFYILFSYLLYVFWREIRLSAWLRGADEEAQGVRRIVLNLFVVFLPFLYYVEMNTHHGYYAGSIGARFQEKGHLRLSRLDVFTHPTEVEWLNIIVSKIKLHSKIGDPIFAVPLNPVFYYLTDRVNPTPYDWILPGMLNETAQARVVEQLRARPPKVILFSNLAIDGREERRFSNYAPLIFRYFQENYVVDEQVGYFQVLIPALPEGALERPDLQGF